MDRKCTKCGIIKDVEEFYKDSYKIDNLYSSCKKCVKSYQDKNKEYIKEYRIAYRSKNKENAKDYNKRYNIINRDKNIAYCIEYRLKNKEKIENYRIENRERAKEYFKEYRKTEKGKQVNRQATRKRRALKKEMNENFTIDDERYTYSLFRGKCFNCCTEESLTIDHLNSLSKGYCLTRTNAIVLCQSCNSKKSSKVPNKFFTENQLTELRELGMDI